MSLSLSQYAKGAAGLRMRGAANICRYVSLTKWRVCDSGGAMFSASILPCCEGVVLLT